MFEFSGKRLVQSFLDMSTDKTTMLFCTENYKIEDDEKHSNVIFEDIGNYEFLTNWLEENKDIIPIQLGGEYDHTTDPQAQDKHMIPGKMNYKASLWFRKVSALHYAYHKYIKTGEFNTLIWVDSDCFFINNINIGWAINLFKGKNGFIMMGNRRQKQQIGVESGLWGIRDKYDFLEDIFRTYEKKRYQRSLYWGDGHVMGYLLRRPMFLEKYGLVDLAEELIANRVMSFVPEINKVIIHAKGQHFIENIDYEKDLTNYKKKNYRFNKKPVSKETFTGDKLSLRTTPRISKSALKIKYGQLFPKDD